MFNNKTKLKKGFTLVELMVASSLFLTVMLIVSGSIVSILSANQKSKTLRSVMDNLNLTLETMTRNIRFGKNYNCGSVLPLTSPRDCPAGDTSLTIRSMEGKTVTYSLVGSSISRVVDNGVTTESSNITSPDVVITSLNFWVLGSAPYPDTLQPKVIVTVSGYVGADTKTRSNFSLQTTISQRSFDFQ